MAGEDEARKYLHERERFTTKVWRKGRIGKVFVILFVLALAAPFTFDLIVVVYVLFFILPSAVGVTEHIAALALIFAALHAIALAAQRWAAQLWEYAFLMRPKKHKIKKKDPPE